MGGLTFEQVLARAKAMLGLNTLILAHFFKESLYCLG